MVLKNQIKVTPEERMILKNQKNHYHLLMKTGYPTHFDYDEIPDDMEVVFMNGVFRHGSRFWSNRLGLSFNNLLQAKVLNTKQGREKSKLVNEYSQLVSKYAKTDLANICNKGRVELKELTQKLYNRHSKYFNKSRKVYYETTKKHRTIQTKDVVTRKLFECNNKKLTIQKMNSHDDDYPLANRIDFRGSGNKNNAKVIKTFVDPYKYVDNLSNKFISHKVLKQVSQELGFPERIDYPTLNNMVMGLFSSLTLTSAYPYRGFNEKPKLRRYLSCFPSKHINLQETIYNMYVRTGLSYSYYIIELSKLLLTRTIANKMIIKLSNLFLEQIINDLDNAMLEHITNKNKSSIVDPRFYFAHAETVMPVLSHLMFMHTDIDKESNKIKAKLRKYIEKMKSVENLGVEESKTELKKMYQDIVEYGSKLVSHNNNLNWVTPMSSNLLFRLMRSKNDNEYYVQMLLNGRTFIPPAFQSRKYITLKEFRALVNKNNISPTEFTKLSGIKR